MSAKLSVYTTQYEIETIVRLKILNGLEHPNLEENLVSIPVDYVSEEHASHTLGGQSREEAYDSLKIKKPRANEKGAKWKKVDHVSNTQTMDTPKVSINVGTKRGLVEYGIKWWTSIVVEGRTSPAQRKNIQTYSPHHIDALILNGIHPRWRLIGFYGWLEEHKNA